MVYFVLKVVENRATITLIETMDKRRCKKYLPIGAMLFRVSIRLQDAMESAIKKHIRPDEKLILTISETASIIPQIKSQVTVKIADAGYKTFFKNKRIAFIL